MKVSRWRKRELLYVESVCDGPAWQWLWMGSSGSGGAVITVAAPTSHPPLSRKEKRKTLLGFQEEEKRVMGVVQDIRLSLDYCQLSLSTSNEIVHLPC